MLMETVKPKLLQSCSRDDDGSYGVVLDFDNEHEHNRRVVVDDVDDERRASAVVSSLYILGGCGWVYIMRRDMKSE